MNVNNGRFQKMFEKERTMENMMDFVSQNIQNSKKKIIPITNGEIIFPNKRPNLNHILLSGLNKFEFRSPKNKKIIDIINDHNLIFSSFNNG